ncbi:unnamed protein product [Calypogeia fissa]
MDEDESVAMSSSLTRISYSHTIRSSDICRGRFCINWKSESGDRGAVQSKGRSSYWDTLLPSPRGVTAWNSEAWMFGAHISSARLKRKEPVQSRLDERSRPGSVRVPLYFASEVYGGGSGENQPKFKISQHTRALTSSRSLALPSKAYLEPIVEEDPIILGHLMQSSQEFVDASSLLASTAGNASNWKERVKKLSRGISANAAVRYLSHLSNRRRIVKVQQSPA